MYLRNAPKATVNRLALPRHTAAIALACAAPLAFAMPSPPSIRVVSVAPDIGLVDVVVDRAAERATARWVDQSGAAHTAPLQSDGERGVAARVLLGAGWSERGVEVEVRDADGSSWRRRLRAAAPAPGPDVPSWAMGRVWYQVFPERWRNGNPGNDPNDPAIVRLDWASPWWTTTPEEVELAMQRRFVDPIRHPFEPDAATGAFGATVFARRYGGDLQGVVEKLDHLVALGVDGLYLCPIFASSSLHKYDASDYRHVDPTLGDPGDAPDLGMPLDRAASDPASWVWTPADRYFVDVLLPEAKRRGLRVMLDGVWNHVGLDHAAFRNVRRLGTRSPYADWFDVDFDEQGRVIGWRAWDGRNGDLPAFRQTADGDLAPGPKEHIFAVTRRWMDPNGDGDPSDGIDGWRLDVAAEVGRTFWRDWRAHVRAINPRAVLVAELWFDGAAYFDGTAFDAQMDYPFATAVTAWLGGAEGTSADDLAARLSAMRGVRPGVDLAQLTLLTSHDTARLVSMLDNPGTAYDRGAETAAVMAGQYHPGPASPRALALARVGVAMQVMMSGAPMIYGGDEFGLAGPDDPSNRQPVIWPDQADQVEPDRRPDAGQAAAYAALLGLRHDAEIGPVLRLGRVMVRGVGADAVVIERALGRARVAAICQRGGAAIGLSDAGIPDHAERVLIGNRQGYADNVVIWKWSEDDVE